MLCPSLHTSMAPIVVASQVSAPELADRIRSASQTDPTDTSAASLSAIFGGMVTRERLQSSALPLLQSARPARRPPHPGSVFLCSCCPSSGD